MNKLFQFFYINKFNIFLKILCANLYYFFHIIIFVFFPFQIYLCFFIKTFWHNFDSFLNFGEVSKIANIFGRYWLNLKRIGPRFIYTSRNCLRGKIRIQSLILKILSSK